MDILAKAGPMPADRVRLSVRRYRMHEINVPEHLAAVSNLRLSHPPGSPVEVRRWTLDSFGQLRTLRASLHEALTGEPLPDGGELDEIPEKMALIASELATNALAHGKPPTVVELRRTDRAFILDVADEAPNAEPEFAEGRAPGAGGMGLRLARDFALDLGWYVADGVKHIWAEVDIPGA
jgi:serine/threonine-protein kinase RsbW